MEEKCRCVDWVLKLSLFSIFYQLFFLIKANAKPYIWNYGEVLSRNLTHDYTISVNMKKKKIFGKKDYKVTGSLTDHKNKIE